MDRPERGSRRSRGEKDKSVAGCEPKGVRKMLRSVCRRPKLKGEDREASEPAPKQD